MTADIFPEMAEKDVFITGEALDLFWDCLDEDILDNEFQEQIGNGLEEVNKLEKHVISANYYLVAYFAKNFVCLLLLFSFSLISKF